PCCQRLATSILLKNGLIDARQGGNEPPALTAVDRVPWSGVADVCYHRRPAGLGGSGCHGGQADERILAHWGGGFQCHIARALNGPFVVLFEQDRTDETELPHLGKYPPPRSVA